MQILPINKSIRNIVSSCLSLKKFLQFMNYIAINFTLYKNLKQPVLKLLLLQSQVDYLSLQQIHLQEWEP